MTKLPSPRTVGRHDVLLDNMSVKLHDDEDVVAVLHVVSSNSRGMQEHDFVLCVMMTMSVYGTVHVVCLGQEAFGWVCQLSYWL